MHGIYQLSRYLRSQTHGQTVRHANRIYP